MQFFSKSFVKMWWVFDLDFTLYGQELKKYENKPPEKFYKECRWNPRLNKFLKLLPGRCLLFTNGNDAHADEVIKRMRMKSIFPKRVTRDSYGIMKPNPQVYAKVIEDFKMPGKHIIFFEDTPENLTTAKRFGWITVLIHPSKSMRNRACDFQFSDISSALFYFLRKMGRNVSM